MKPKKDKVLNILREYYGKDELTHNYCASDLIDYFEKELAYPSYVKCTHCDGVGKVYGNEATCAGCKGTGTLAIKNK